MALTVGAAILLVGLLFIIYYGYTVALKRSEGLGATNLQRCTLCLQKFERSKLVERLVGDSKLFYFCPSCVQGLYSEIEDVEGRESRNDQKD